jgi:hypothetical protein
VSEPRPTALDSTEPDPTEGSAKDPAFEILWTHVLDNWDDDRAHLAFLEHCQQSDRLLPAAKRYRHLTASEPHKAQAERRLKGITAMAMAKLSSSRTTTSVAKRQAGRLVALIFLVAAATGLLIFYGLR